MRLSPSQLKVINLMQKGYNLTVERFFSSPSKFVNYIRLRGNGEERASFATIDRLLKLGVIEDLSKGEPIEHLHHYRLTEKGRNVGIEG